MRLSNRLWRLVASRIVDRPECEALAVWAKVREQAKGKRHALTTIPLSVEEETLVVRTMNDATDDYFVFCLKHEAEHNPFFPGG